MPVVLLVALAAAALHAMLFPHRYFYLYNFGALSSDAAYFVAGPFVRARMGKAEYDEGPGKPLPDVYLHWQNGSSVRLTQLSEETFVRYYGATVEGDLRGYREGRAGDMKFMFHHGVLSGVVYVYAKGSPCFSTEPEGKRYCFPLSGSDAERLFGKPSDKGQLRVPWI